MPTRRPVAALAFAAGLVVIAGGVTGLLLTRHSTPAMRPAAVGVGAVPAPTGPIVAAFPAPTGPIVAVSQSAAPKPVAAPVSLTIPLIGVQTNLMTLGLEPDGELQVPPLNMVSVAGWYTGSPRPGAIGSAIIVGHIDGDAGNVEGVFFRLRQLSAGDKIYVKRSDGTLVEFRVTSVQQYPKDHFPTEAVYGPVPDPELRLITCGGAYDPATHHYVLNLVVYATEVS
jgi:sortase (surface protein transpeptidase)